MSIVIEGVYKQVGQPDVVLPLRINQDGYLLQSGSGGDVQTLATQLVSTNNAQTVASVLHGKTTAGGGAYVDVKVTPSGALVADTTSDQLPEALGQALSVKSLPVVIASDQSNIKVDVQSMPIVAGQATSSLQVTGNNSLASMDTKTPALSGGKVPVTDPTALPLPAGASTSALQTTANTSLSSMDTKTPALVGGKVPVTDPAALPLPAGASTSALQTTANTSLSSMDTKTPALVGGKVPVTDPTALPLPTGASTSALQTTANTSLSSMDTKTPALVGGKVPVTDPAALPLPTGASTSDLQTTGNNSLSTIAFNSSNLLFAFTDLTGILTATTTSAAFRPTAGQSYSINIDVTAFTGTNRTLDVVIQESEDNGNTWMNIWTLPRITTPGSYRTPTIPYRGVLIRYVQTIGGTGVSCTRSINRIELNSYMSSSPSQLFDRTLNLNTLGATSAILNTQNAKYIQFGVSHTGGTTAPVLTLQGSEDGVNWYQTTNSVTGDLTLGTAQFTPGQVRSQQFARLIVTTAGVGVTNTYVFIKGF